MKLPKLFLGLFIWLATMGAAYYVGLNRINPAESNGGESTAATQTRAPLNKQRTEIATPATPSDRTRAIMALSQQDLNEALLQAGELSESEKRILLAEAFALPSSDYRRAGMLRELLRQLAETLPRDALAMADKIGSRRETERTRIAILQVWAENDPVAALAWAELELANEPLRSQSNQLLAIYRGYASANPKAAFAAALALPTGNNIQQRTQTAALETIIAQQIESGGLLDAKLQVEMLADGATKNTLLSELVDEWAEYDPQGAAAYVESLGADAPASITTRLVGEWAENDPAAAAAWLSARELDEDTLSRASTAIIREWTRYDMAASAEWLNSQPSSPALDRAVMSYTYRAAQEDPANAMTWAESIGNDWMRTRMMQHVAASWKNDDPDSFQSYIQNSEFDQAQKKQLQEAQPFRGRGRGW